jgi:hypothetical protein
MSAKTVFRLHPWEGKDNMVSVISNEGANKWEYDIIAGSTGVERNYGFASNPVGVQYHLTGNDEWEFPLMFS